MKKYTIIHMQRIGMHGNWYLPKIEYIQCKDLREWCKKSDFDIQFIFDGHVKHTKD